MIRRVLAAGGGGGVITTLLSAGWAGVILGVVALVVIVVFLGWVVAKPQRAERLSTVLGAVRGSRQASATGRSAPRGRQRPRAFPVGLEEGTPRRSRAGGQDETTTPPI